MWFTISKLFRNVVPTLFLLPLVLVMMTHLSGCGGSQTPTLINTPPPDNPSPTIISLTPTSGVSGAQSFTLTVNGTGFVNHSIVRWNGSDKVTTFVSSTRLTAAIPASDSAAAANVNVTVFNPAP